MASNLMHIFRPEKREVWEILSRQLGGRLILSKGFKDKDAVVASYKNWTIVLDSYSKPKRATRTRIRANYVNRDSFYFRIFRRSLASSIKKVAGMQDVIIGYPAFDDDFIIQGNDERKLRSLFTPDRIRELISWQPEISLENIVDDSWVTAPFREGTSMLMFEVKGLITDIDRLKDLYNLFAEILNQLCHIGSAYEDDPSLR
ncbi:MAG: DUF3137 domain-containing protein [Bacteroidota bacterium]